eukprot:CAMPEP_0203760674 /NCGR_PEP_ID=MMETSP0098-20131031/13920_1 /ASSEMBLY_ACC=CAM_ASM_000208 /TAXON_ID=96639 /ORGANISM=" , Strain NY0313808BC1" /LENGTH=230 /DNA_ID=CAMNT_0050654345 /DNA_START=17 /DNA_END=705 /DNA_ORIENTATION=-
MTRVVQVLACAATAFVAKGSISTLRGPRELNVAGQHGKYGYDHITNATTKKFKNLGDVVGTDEWADCILYEPRTKGACAPSKTRCWQKELKLAQRVCDAHDDCLGVTKDNCGYEPRKGGGLKHHVAVREAWIKQRAYAKIPMDGRPLDFHGVKGTKSWPDCTQYSPANETCAPNTKRCWQKDLASAQKICNAHLDCTGITRDYCGFEPRTGGRQPNNVDALQAWEKLSVV